MIIGIDFDGVINNMLDTWVKWLNIKHGTSVQVKDVTDWEMVKSFPSLTLEELFAPLNTPEFWDEVSIKKEAPEVIERLMAEDHEVYVVTSSHYKTLDYKLKKCLFAHLPFLDKEHVIITYNKSLIRCDVLLDDAEHNLSNFTGVRVLFDAPYNQGCSCADYRVGTWKEFYILISELSAGKPRPPFARIHQFKAGRGMGKTAWLHQMIYDSYHSGYDIPCYVIMQTRAEFDYFCRSYRERFGEVCRAKLFEFNQTLEPGARLFVDMPSTFPVMSKAFAAFRNEFLGRNHLLFIADFENTSWHSVY